MTHASDAARTLAAVVAGALTWAGAAAVVLTGSHARSTASRESDIDLYAVGDGPAYRLERRADFLVSVSWRTVAQIETEFTSPADAAASVPGWRQAVILSDSHGIAARLIETAHAWTWDVIGDDRLNGWVADQLTGYAEEVHKLVSHLEQGSLQFAAVERSVLALRLPMILAVHERILYESENGLWDLVAGRMGTEWAKNQSAALGLTGQPFQDSCNGALALYVMACEAASGLFDERQRAVVDHACKLARQASDDVHLNSVILILIEQDGCFLMIEEGHGQVETSWYFPSGAVEAGESLVDAAIREALEETGYVVEPTHLLRVDHGYFAASRQIPWWRHIVVATPNAKIEPVPPEVGIRAVEWLSPADLERLSLRSDDALDIMNDYLENGPGLPLQNYAFSPTGVLRGFYH